MKKLRFLLTIPLMLGAAVSLTSCNKGPIDYVEKTKLSDYSDYTLSMDTNFLDDGHGYVDYFRTIDGDTAWFHQTEQERPEKRLVKSRFFAIDTPESTGIIEEWGKKAAAFTKGKLESAKTIYLTTPTLKTEPAGTDSTGTRFMTLIWISEKENAPIEDLKCLNLWLIQEGYSNSTGTADCPIHKQFRDADLQAQNLKVNRWSGPDPDFFRGAATPVTLKYLIEDWIKNKGVSSHDGLKVQFTGIVTQVKGYDSFVTYEEMNEDTNVMERFSVQIFTQYKSYEPLLRIGNEVSIIGKFGIRFGNPQVNDVKYNEYLPGDEDIKLLATDKNLESLDYTIDQVDNQRIYVNNSGYFRNLHATGKGWDAVDKTTQKKSGAMNIEVADDAGNVIMFRVPKDVWLINAETGLRESSYTYLSKYGKKFDLYATVKVFEPGSDDNETATETFWQLELCNKDDVIYK